MLRGTLFTDAEWEKVSFEGTASGFFVKTVPANKNRQAKGLQKQANFCGDLGQPGVNVLFTTEGRFVKNLGCATQEIVPEKLSCRDCKSTNTEAPTAAPTPAPTSSPTFQPTQAPTQMSMPCGDGTSDGKLAPCPTDPALLEQRELRIKVTGPCRTHSRFSLIYGSTVVLCDLEPTVVINQGSHNTPMLFTNEHGHEMQVDKVVYWSRWGTQILFTQPKGVAYAEEVMLGGGFVTATVFHPGAPSSAPTHYPTAAPTSNPTPAPTAQPTPWPTRYPTVAPTVETFLIPCVNPSNAHEHIACPSDPAEKALSQPVLDFKAPCYYNKGNSDAWGRFMIFCPLKKTVDSKISSWKRLVFTNERGDSMEMETVVRWAWNGDFMNGFPATENMTEINKVMYDHGAVHVSNYVAPTPPPTPLPLTEAHIVSCKASVNQHGYNCKAAFDGNVHSKDNGWAFWGMAPVDGTWTFTEPTQINRAQIKSGIGRSDHRLTDFEIYYSTSASTTTNGVEWKNMTGVKFAEPVDGGSISGNSVTLPGRHMLELEFDKVEAQSVRLHVRGTDASNDNLVLTELRFFSQ